MQFTLSEIAKIVNGEVIGDSDLLIEGVSEIQNGIVGTISFIGNPKYKKFLNTTKASAVFVSDKDQLTGENGIVVTDPQLAIAKTLKLFYTDPEPYVDSKKNASIHPQSKVSQKVTLEPGVVISKGAVIRKNSWIGSNVYVGPGAEIGESSKIYPNVTIYNDTIIGNRVIVHSGTVIGSDGFGFVTDQGINKKIPQTGNVIIGDDVEIGSNSSIDRATIGSTKIGEMTKIDNLVHIAHNVVIGKGCYITGQVGIAGSANIGNYCSFGGQSGVAPHVKIGDKSIFAAKSGVTKSMKGGEFYAGYPAIKIRQYHKREAFLNKIEKIYKALQKLIKMN